jgi:hypothetical protein
VIELEGEDRIGKEVILDIRVVSLKVADHFLMAPQSFEADSTLLMTHPWRNNSQMVNWLGAFPENFLVV